MRRSDALGVQIRRVGVQHCSAKPAKSLGAAPLDLTCRPSQQFLASHSLGLLQKGRNEAILGFN